MIPVPHRIVRAHTSDEPLLAHISEGNEDPPAHIDLSQHLRQNIGELLLYALDRNVDIDIRNDHIFTSHKKTVTRKHSCNSSFPYILLGDCRLIRKDFFTCLTRRAYTGIFPLLLRLLCRSIILSCSLRAEQRDTIR